MPFEPLVCYNVSQFTSNSSPLYTVADDPTTRSKMQRSPVPRNGFPLPICKRTALPPCLDRKVPGYRGRKVSKQSKQAVRLCLCLCLCACGVVVVRVSGRHVREKEPKAKARSGALKVRPHVHDAVSPQRTGCTVASPDADTELTLAELDDGLLTFFYTLSLGLWPDKLCNTCPSASELGHETDRDRTRTRMTARR